ncbi:GGDEF domain-containing protein [Paenibacillus albiflavus]|uniref:GGDEF domain-containing protein n=1 Tax=Paenibacillus albiflavus TaxID=2545760 RepID=A0A4R4EBW7_9BACL|nr:GGDEF domain-containing protein [Paenibacillus albiflavus]TCZ76633.1 GGDEF domain-containing protein [Paenibacillus albiflavus]
MNFRFGVKLTFTMIVFAVVISFTIATIDHVRLRDQAIQNKRNQVENNELMAKYALETIEKAYEVFGNNITLKMRENSRNLDNLYIKNPSVDTWDFASLKESLGMDIYLIDEHNVIAYSSYKPDIGLDFNACCQKLVSVMNERRLSGEFYDDGMDNELNTGLIKKYSYMPTHDQKYIIQLGYSLQEGDIFNRFNFLNTIDELVKSSPSTNKINVLNIGGYILGNARINDDQKVSGGRRQSFEQTLQTGETTEYRGIWNNEPAIYRYVAYVSKYDTGTTRNKVLEIIYNDKDLETVLSNNKQAFIFQLFIILIITIVLSFIISGWVAKPMHLAFHDSLTGLKNRAAFDELLKATIAEENKSTALLMIDLDNFKLVNDNLGHDRGDQLLKSVAECITQSARKDDITIRLGGDEFVLVMPSADKREAGQIAARIIDAIVESTTSEIDLKDENVTVSIGISLFPEDGVDPDTLCKKADQALYASKENGKNQFHFYEDMV